MVKPTSQRRHAPAIAAVALALAAIPLAGCGEGSQATGGAASTAAATTATAPAATTPATTAASRAKAAASAADKHSNARGEAIIKYGKPGPPNEKDAVAATVRSYYAALVADDRTVLCRVLSKQLLGFLRGELEHPNSAASALSSPAARATHVGGCVDLLGHVIRPPSPTRPKLPPTTVTQIRLYRDKGFAIIRNDANGHLKELTIERERGAWKIGSLIATRVR